MFNPQISGLSQILFLLPGKQGGIKQRPFNTPENMVHSALIYREFE